MVDEITTMPKVNIPDSVKTGFSQSAQARWPETRVVGQIDVLIGKDAEAYQPDIIGRVDNMGLYSRPSQERKKSIFIYGFSFFRENFA